jgi:phosphoribosyl 1,2-cyclic phosphodiesterase
MRICVLASGSAGNACLISTDTTRILVDCGISVKQLAARLAEIGEKPERISGIAISHAHGDHVNGLARLVRHGIKRGRAIPTYLSEYTAPVIDWDGLEAPPVKLFKAGSSFVIGDIEVSSFSTPHDCVDPVAFTLRSNGSKVGIATDLGFIPDAIRARFRGCQAVLLESNHDTEMLRVGPHPHHVKIRVGGRYGHLSNHDTTDYLAGELDPDVQHVMLLHLSQDNNLPQLARMGAEIALRRRGIAASLTIAEQDKRTEIIEI